MASSGFGKSNQTFSTQQPQSMAKTKYKSGHKVIELLSSMRLDVKKMKEDGVEVEMLKIYRDMINSMDSDYSGKKVDLMISFNTLRDNEYLVTCREKNLKILLEE